MFRALGRLEAEGEVQRVELDDGKARFEPSGEHHEHIRCESCGSVAPVPCSLRSEVLPSLQRHTGYSIRTHRLVMSGVCPDCAGD